MSTPAPGGNAAYAAAARDLRASNASGVHEDRRTKRKRSRADQRLAWQREEGVE